MKRILALLSFPVALSAQVLLTDDFSGGSIDSGKWSVILPGGSSSVVQSGGLLTTTARGVLGSVADFSAPYSISGSFTMLDGLEHFNIVFRSDLSGADSLSAEAYSFRFRMMAMLFRFRDTTTQAIHRY